MGEVYAEVKLIKNAKGIKKRLLVDTGSTFSWIMGKDLIGLGVKPVDTEVLETLDKRVVKRKIGFVEIECLGRRAPTGVIFAEKK